MATLNLFVFGLLVSSCVAQFPFRNNPNQFGGPNFNTGFSAFMGFGGQSPFSFGTTRFNPGARDMFEASMNPMASFMRSNFNCAKCPFNQSAYGIQGSVYFRQPVNGGQTLIVVDVYGLPTPQGQQMGQMGQMGQGQMGQGQMGQMSQQIERAIHITEFGDISDGCKHVGAHYNPRGQSHGDRLSRERHVGDLGNFVQVNGQIRPQRPFRDRLVRVNPGDETVVGRSVVIRERRDDLARANNLQSLQTGNAGRPIACCTIGISDCDYWITNGFGTRNQRNQNQFQGNQFPGNQPGGIPNSNPGPFDTQPRSGGILDSGSPFGTGGSGSIFGGSP